MPSPCAGREGREFGAKAKLKQKKTGGLSNREKDKRKRLPMAARSGQVKKRLAKHKSKSAKNYKVKMCLLQDWQWRPVESVCGGTRQAGETAGGGARAWRPWNALFPHMPP